MSTKRVLSGVRPTGQLHIGNYRGAIKQFLDLQESGHECFYFVADLHALTEVTGPTDNDRLSVEVVKNYLACGVDPARCVLYRQSHIPEISEMALLLGNIITVAQLRRCTTYKGKVDDAVIEELVRRGMPEDAARKLVREKEEYGDLTPDELFQISNRFSYGLLGYPVLMASDILAVRADLVPVGADQTQHVEFARDYARTFNRMFGRETFVVPELTEQSTLTVPGTDGSLKMGKSDGNTITLLEDLRSARQKIMRMPTQVEPVGEKTQGTQNLYNMIELFCPEKLANEFLQRYGNPEDKYFGEMKKRLADHIVALLEPIQARYAQISDDEVRKILEQGAKKVRPIAAQVLADMHRAVGLST